MMINGDLDGGSHHFQKSPLKNLADVGEFSPKKNVSSVILVICYPERLGKCETFYLDWVFSGLSDKNTTAIKLHCPRQPWIRFPVVTDIL